ncbi:MAG: 50S ribosomal protein L9 [Candidatus Paceibacterota bacterium]
MKVIMLQDVAKVGRRFDIVEVPHGHALNKLIPQNLAAEATPENVKRVRARKEKLSEIDSAETAKLEEAIAALGGKTVQVTVEANEQGHLFQALKSDRIAAALESEGVTITPAYIHINQPIKDVGTHTVTIGSGESQTELTIEVMRA